jgi:hypothetical protein
MVMRRAGNARPEAISAARTRSRASETALSGKPTIVKAGMPGATIRRAHLDAFKRNRRNALYHLSPWCGKRPCRRVQQIWAAELPGAEENRLVDVGWLGGQKWRATVRLRASLTTIGGAGT